jgi:transposase InsO family protein
LHQTFFDAVASADQKELCLAKIMATDFFTVEVPTLRGLITYYVLFFIHLERRRICLAGVTRRPDQAWMEQMARNVTMEESVFWPTKDISHDRDGKYCPSFRQLVEAENVETLLMPPQSPNLNAYAERWVRSVKEEWLSKRILFGELSLRAPLSPGTKSSAEEQLAAFSFDDAIGKTETADGSTPRTTR